MITIRLQAAILAAAVTVASCSTSAAAPWSMSKAAAEYAQLEAAYEQGQHQVSTVNPRSSITALTGLANGLAHICDVYVDGLRQGRWPHQAASDISKLTSEYQKVCSAEKVQGKSKSLAQFHSAPAVGTGLLSAIAALRAKIETELGL